ncbi:ParA family protein [Yersinia ruckeri]|uniref:Plasmid partitioning protein n=1 Tax=Yersinia ruckeri TaxID=29486 RepID=A0A0A8VDJ4_YERRU|nr:ParA family protein [Yersinia ruckeri]EEP97653.1 Cobyrinic acid a,c-diamide synthase [Yersinia ruckeri ATCC 29473]KGA48449.1 SRP54-type, GTPase domain protein [Yersinia ruckeri ATCC 29473]MCK8596683.1 ParA family protein [Yersinia ruckeri]MCK8600010.1 ParA family protein [Yersinia ruckeri]MCW6612471.1 ParA family protein [Yersinia ruckeri]
MIIVIGSQKGGVGKSTLAVNIGGYLLEKGHSVMIVDADDQQSVMSWYNDRDEGRQRLPVVSASGNIKNTLFELDKHYDYVIADTAGRDSQELRSGLLAANIFITPIRPSQMDLDTVSHISNVFNTALDYNETAKGYVLLNMCPTNIFVDEAHQAADLLKEYPSLSLVNSRVCDRKIYRDTWGDSVTVQESENTKAKDEIKNLVEEVIL